MRAVYALGIARVSDSANRQSARGAKSDRGEGGGETTPHRRQLCFFWTEAQAAETPTDGAGMGKPAAVVAARDVDASEECGQGEATQEREEFTSALTLDGPATQLLDGDEAKGAVEVGGEARHEARQAADGMDPQLAIRLAQQRQLAASSELEAVSTAPPVTISSYRRGSPASVHRGSPVPVSAARFDSAPTHAPLAPPCVTP